MVQPTGTSGESETDREAYICVTCATQYPPSAEPPTRCPICEDDRQYVGHDGQQWTTLREMRGQYLNRFIQLELGVTAIVTEPRFGIGQQAYLVETEQGNVLWDLIAYLDETTIAEIEQRGGLQAIAISHPHYYTTMAEWSHAFDDTPIYLHTEVRPWVMRPEAVQFWEDDTLELLPGLTLIRCDGHFAGGTVLHWAAGADGHGILFSGDCLQVVADHRWVSFMYSYPNLIPLDAETVRRVVASVEPYPFERLYGAFGGVVTADAKERVRRSAERYIAHLERPELNHR